MKGHIIIKTLFMPMLIILILTGFLSSKSLASSTYIIDNAYWINDNDKEQIIKVGQEIESSLNIRMIIYTEDKIQRQSDIDAIVNDVMNTIKSRGDVKEVKKYILLIVYNNDIDAIEREQKLNVLNYGGISDPILSGNATMTVARNNNIFALLGEKQYSKACLNLYSGIADKINNHYEIKDKYKKLISHPTHNSSLKDIVSILFWWFFISIVVFIRRYKRQRPFQIGQIMEFDYNGDGLTMFRLPFKLRVKYRKLILGILLLLEIYISVSMIMTLQESNKIYQIMSYGAFIPLQIVIITAIVYIATIKIVLYRDRIVLVSLVMTREEILLKDITKKVYIYGSYVRYAKGLVRNSIVIYTKNHKYPIPFPIVLFDVNQLLEVINYVNDNLINAEDFESQSEKIDYKKMAVYSVIESAIIIFTTLISFIYIINPLLDMI